MVDRVNNQSEKELNEHQMTAKLVGYQEAEIIRLNEETATQKEKIAKLKAQVKALKISQYRHNEP